MFLETILFKSFVRCFTGYLSFCYWVIGVLYIFWTLTYFNLFDLQVFSPHFMTMYLIFLKCWTLIMSVFSGFSCVACDFVNPRSQKLVSMGMHCIDVYIFVCVCFVSVCICLCMHVCLCLWRSKVNTGLTNELLSTLFFGKMPPTELRSIPLSWLGS